MNEAQEYLTIINVLLALGQEVGGKVKALIDLLKPNHTLTDEQIDEIEAAIEADATRRARERAVMGRPSTE